jgi:hypothetical protein
VKGPVLVTFPGQTDFTQVDELSGTRNGDMVHLVGSSGVIIDATRSGTSLSGTVMFQPTPNGDAPPAAKLKAVRS